MSIAALKWALELPIKDMAAKSVLVALADPYSEQNECCWPSMARLQLYTGATERTIQRAIQRLEKLGLVRRHIRPHKTSIFELSLPRQADAPTPSERRSNPVKLTGF
jgi:pyocin large subunit-like protein